MKLHRRMRWAKTAILGGFAAMLVSSVAWAQSGPTRWGEATVIFDASVFAADDNPRILYNPLVVVDEQDSIKVLWEVHRQNAGGSQELSNGIYCIEGDGTRWSPAVDVITAPPGGRTFWPQHAVDGTGRLHLVWVGPNGSLYYGRAPVAKACDVRSWETAVLPISNPVLYGDIEVDAENTIHVAYAANGEDVYYIRSTDDGRSWTDPVAVSSVPPTTATAFPSLAVDAAGRVHLAWEEDRLPEGVPGLGVFYAVSTDDGKSWSEPLMVADGEHTQPTVAALSDQTTHLFWNGRAGLRGRYHQWSADGGHTWTAPDEFISKNAGGGQTGAPRFASDSAGRLHLVSGTDEVTYVAWDGRGWLSSPTNITEYLEYPEIAISRGRVLHVVATDFQRIVYVQGTSDAPEVTTEIGNALPRAAEPTRTSNTPEVQATGSPSPTATAVFPRSGTGDAVGSEGSFFPLVLSAGMAFLLVAVVTGLNLTRRRR